MASIYSVQHLTSLSLEGGNAKIMGSYPLTINQFSATSGTIDLYQGGLILNYQFESPCAQINAAIAAGTLFTSYTKDYPITEAVFDNARIRLTQWMGEPLNGYMQVLTQAAYVGDVNLDGRVTDEDLLGLMANLNHPGTWMQGDMNHDGFVNLTDLNLVRDHIGAGQSMPMLSMMQWSELSPQSLAMIMVPEPGLMGLGLIGGLTFLRRRRVSR